MKKFLYLKVKAAYLNLLLLAISIYHFFQCFLDKYFRQHLKKQNEDILAFKRDENLSIPDNIDYDQFSGLSNEVKAKFKEIRPTTLGQALRIDGITPAAVYILLSHVKRRSIKHIA